MPATFGKAHYLATV